MIFPSSFFRQVLALFFFFLASFPRALALETEVGSVENFGEYVSQVWSWAAEVIFGISVLTIIIGAILFMLSGGDEERANMGQQTIRGAIVSLSIVLFSAVLQKFLQKPTEDIQGVAQLSDASIIITNTINLSLGIVGALAAIGLLISGMRHMLSGGDEEKIESAKKGMKLSLFGLLISLSAWGILQFLLTVWQ